MLGFGRSSGLLGRFGPRRWLRRLWLASLVCALWANRRDVKRWAAFASSAVRERDRRPLSDLLTEAKVRVAVSSDPFLRRDATLEDLHVRDGVVTLLTTTAGWPDPRDQMVKLQRVKGITDVTTRVAAGDGGSPRTGSTSLRDALDAREAHDGTGGASGARNEFAGRG